MKTYRIIPAGLISLLVFTIFGWLCCPVWGQGFFDSDDDGDNSEPYSQSHDDDREDYEYPDAWHFPRNSRPQVQAEERVAALRRFSLELYQAIIEGDQKKNQNVVYSPWSIALVLTMLHDGAKDDTAKEIRKALHFQGNSKFAEKYLHMVGYNARAKENPKGKHSPLIFESANSFWAQEEYDFNDAYLELLDGRFCSSIHSVDFRGNPSEAVREINEWCAESTRKEITSILSDSDIDPNQRMFILNAVYFKGRWMNIFDRQQTKPEWFHHADGSVSKTPMMRQTGGFDYCEGYDFKALRMRYEGNAYMLILLPDEADGLAGLEKSLTPKKLRQTVNQLNPQLVKLKIPRFSLQQDLNLIPTLKHLGVVSAFDTEKANFSKMTDEKGFFIDLFKQNAVIKVDEEGTVAAAVTGGGGVGGGGVPKFHYFHADRPFLFLICEATDNSILFMGRVHYPEEVENENASEEIETPEERE